MEPPIKIYKPEGVVNYYPSDQKFYSRGEIISAIANGALVLAALAGFYAEFIRPHQRNQITNQPQQQVIVDKSIQKPMTLEQFIQQFARKQK